MRGHKDLTISLRIQEKLSVDLIKFSRQLIVFDQAAQEGQTLAFKGFDMGGPGFARRVYLMNRSRKSITPITVNPLSSLLSLIGRFTTNTFCT